MFLQAYGEKALERCVSGVAVLKESQQRQGVFTPRTVHRVVQQDPPTPGHVSSLQTLLALLQQSARLGLGLANRFLLLVEMQEVVVVVAYFWILHPVVFQRVVVLFAGCAPASSNNLLLSTQITRLVCSCTVVFVWCSAWCFVVTVGSVVLL